MNRTTKKLLKICLGAGLILVFTGTAMAGMYKWTDKDGNVHYSQQPPTEGNYETMHVDTQSPDGSDTGPASQSSPSYSTPGTSDNGSSGGGSDAVQQTEAKAAAQRQKNCQQAKKALETYTVYRRLRDKSGKVIRLSDTERAKRIKQAKDAIQEFCQ